MNEEYERYLAINTAFRELGTEPRRDIRFWWVIGASLILGLVVVSVFAAAVLSAPPAGF